MVAGGIVFTVSGADQLLDVHDVAYAGFFVPVLPKAAAAAARPPRLAAS